MLPATRCFRPFSRGNLACAIFVSNAKSPRCQTVSCFPTPRIPARHQRLVHLTDRAKWARTYIQDAVIAQVSIAGEKVLHWTHLDKRCLPVAARQTHHSAAAGQRGADVIASEGDAKAASYS